MNVILIMIPLSLLILIGAVVAFFWAVNHDQFEDLNSPSLLPIADAPDEDEEPEQPKQTDPELSAAREHHTP